MVQRQKGANGVVFLRGVLQRPPRAAPSRGVVFCRILERTPRTPTFFAIPVGQAGPIPMRARRESCPWGGEQRQDRQRVHRQKGSFSAGFLKGRQERQRFLHFRRTGVLPVPQAKAKTGETPVLLAIGGVVWHHKQQLVKYSRGLTATRITTRAENGSLSELTHYPISPSPSEGEGRGEGERAQPTLGLLPSGHKKENGEDHRWAFPNHATGHPLMTAVSSRLGLQWP